MPSSPKLKTLVIFASGKGSNAASILNYFDGKGFATVALIVCNNIHAGVLDIARAHNIPFLIIDKQTFREKLLIEQLKEKKPDLIVLAGFLWQVPSELLKTFPNKVINIHPALLPKFGGKGMYGMKVHESVLASNEKESGMTIHFVNEKYDDGRNILQAYCSIIESDTAATIAAKVGKLEHFFYPKTIEYLLNEQ